MTFSFVDAAYGIHTNTADNYMGQLSNKLNMNSCILSHLDITQD